MDHPSRILIVDDEETICTIIADALQGRGYQVKTSLSVVDALRACKESTFDLALIDLKIPGSMDGLDLLKEIHRHWPQVVVIMLTAYATLDSALAALRQGAHDYLIKPASIAEIIQSVESGLAKGRAEARRHHFIQRLEETLQELKGEEIADNGDSSADRFVQTSTLKIDRLKRLVVRGDKPLMLTATEFDLLDYLTRNVERVVTARELIKAVQGYDLHEVDARPIVRVHIQRLRQKIEDNPQHPRHILNVRGKGYRFAG